MKIAIIGATGVLGRAVATEATQRGHEVIRASRRPRGGGVDIDVTTGTRLESVVEADAVVYAVNSRRDARGVLVDGLARVLGHADATGAVVVLPSIVGCTHVGGAYYRAKAAQEALLAQAPRALTVRLTQFHELVAAASAGAARWGVLPTGSIPLQPMASGAAASHLLGLVEERTVGVRAAAGPLRQDIGALTREWARAHGKLRVPLRLPRRLLGAAGDGALCPAPGDAALVGATFAEWLHSASPQAAR